MAGEILAEDNSPMMMTVGQYNDRVAYTWKLATEAEQERIIKLLEEFNYGTAEDIAEFLKGPPSSEHDLCLVCRYWAYAPKDDYRHCQCI